MAYVPNATTTTEPVESRSVESAALEFRTLKEKVVENSAAILTSLRDATSPVGVLPSVALRAGKALVFDSAGNPAAAAIGDAADPGLRSDLAASSGAALVGYNGGTVKTALDSTVRLTDNQSIAGVKTFTNGIVLGVDLPISDGGTGASTAAAAFDNLKQLSTETYTGVVELATGVEAAAGTDTTRVLTPAGLRSGLNSTGSAPIYAARAWVNFRGVPVNGTYTQTSGPNIIVTMTGHGLTNFQRVNLLFTSGTAPSGSYDCTVLDANTFYVVSAVWTTTSGSVTLQNLIRASGNVSSITDNGVGNYTVNFTTAMPDANYAVVGSVAGSTGTGAGGNNVIAEAVGVAGTSYAGKSTAAVQVITSDNNNDTAIDAFSANIAIFR